MSVVIGQGPTTVGSAPSTTMTEVTITDFRLSSRSMASTQKAQAAALAGASREVQDSAAEVFREGLDFST